MPDAAAGSPERAKTLDYLRTRAAALGPAEIPRASGRPPPARGLLADVPEAEARRAPGAGGWSIARVADRGADDDPLGRRAAPPPAGRRPPRRPSTTASSRGPPRGHRGPSCARAWAANAEFDALLGAAAAGAAGDADGADGPRGEPARGRARRLCCRLSWRSTRSFSASTCWTTAPRSGSCGRPSRADRVSRTGGGDATPSPPRGPRRSEHGRLVEAGADELHPDREAAGGEPDRHLEGEGGRSR
jgi:hypothetical protein